jgi:mutator protein MutT
MSPISVAAGLIFHSGRLLIAQRHATSHLGGLWEFPGGKLEPGESFGQCLERELHEELGIRVCVGGLLESIQHDYPTKRVFLKFFICTLLSGEPRPLGCAAIQWVERHQLNQFEFPAADATLLEKLRNTPKLWS